MQRGGVVGSLLVAETVVERAVEHGAEALLDAGQPGGVGEQEPHLDSASAGALAGLCDRGRGGVEAGHPVAAGG